MGIAVINYTEENVPFVLRWKMKYIFYLTVKSIMKLRKNILGFGPNRGIGILIELCI